MKPIKFLLYKFHWTIKNSSDLKIYKYKKIWTLEKDNLNELYLELNNKINISIYIKSKYKIIDNQKAVRKLKEIISEEIDIETKKKLNLQNPQTNLITILMEKKNKIVEKI